MTVRFAKSLALQQAGLIDARMGLLLLHVK